MHKRAFIYIIALTVYAIIMSITWVIGTRDARKKTDAQLDYAVFDFYSSVEGAIDTMLWHSARDLVKSFGEPRKFTIEELASIAEKYDVDELNVVNRDGIIIASNDIHCIGVDMSINPMTAPFLALTQGVTTTISQPFRVHAHNSNVRAKYLAVAFPEGNGYIEVGFNERRLATMLPSILSYIFDGWIIGRTGFYLCADLKTGKLLSNPARHRNKARTLAETGYKVSEGTYYETTVRKSDSEMADAVRNGGDSENCFEQRLFGERCRCRAFLFGEHRFVAAVPNRENFGIRNKNAAVLGTLLLIVLGGFTVLLDRVYCAHKAIQAFYASEDEHRAKDMKIAASIQESVLPAPIAPNACFALDASMQAARDVGGDFYDFFMLNETHVAFLVADVSGKGITAALYMMNAKTLIKDELMSCHNPAVTLNRVNAELCRNNSAEMFITAWVGVLDLETGEVMYANAGHNPPVLLPSAQYMTAKSGPVLAFMDGIEYKQLSFKLAPGDSLFLYTDGVTEATDAKNELFGEERLLTALKAAQTTDASPAKITAVLRMVVTAFVEGMPQADDITMLAIRYLASPVVSAEVFEPSQKGIAKASAFLDEALKDLAQDKLSQLHIILDEICSNIVKHSKASEFEIELENTPTSNGVRMTFRDDGVAFDPLNQPPPDITLSAEERPIGGLGIMMVRQMASNISYCRNDNRNVLTIELG